MKLEETNVLLTGASGGIGTELAVRLADQGARLLLTARSEQRLRSLRERLAGKTAEVRSVAADLGTPEGRATVIRAAASFNGGVSIVINNAGTNHFGRFEDQAAADIENLFNANLLGPVLMTHALLPALRAAERALVVNVGSILGSIGLPGQVGYASSKFAIHGFSEALRRELAGSSIGVLYIAPRSTETAMNDSAQRHFNERAGVRSDTAARVADKIVAAIIHDERERFIGWPERFFVKVNSLLPGLVDRSVGPQADWLAPPAQVDTQALPTE